MRRGRLYRRDQVAGRALRGGASRYPVPRRTRYPVDGARRSGCGARWNMAEITRIGSSRPLQVDVRIVAATNENLPDRCRDGTSSAPTCSTGCRSRWSPCRRCPRAPGRRAGAGRAFRRRMAWRWASTTGAASGPMRSAALVDYQWPGNVRELRDVVERAVLPLGSRRARIRADRALRSVPFALSSITGGRALGLCRAGTVAVPPKTCAQCDADEVDDGPSDFDAHAPALMSWIAALGGTGSTSGDRRSLLVELHQLPPRVEAPRADRG